MGNSELGERVVPAAASGVGTYHSASSGCVGEFSFYPKVNGTFYTKETHDQICIFKQFAQQIFLSTCKDHAKR